MINDFIHNYTNLIPALIHITIKILQSIILITIVILFNSCVCDKECPACYALDKESCECIVDLECLCNDGILNGDEDSVDCGGSCMPCFDCNSVYCFFLSNGISTEQDTFKKWIFFPFDWYLIFYSNGYYIERTPGCDARILCTAKGYWKFDNPDSPNKIIITYLNDDAAACCWPEEAVLSDIIITEKEFTFKDWKGRCRTIIRE